MHFFSFLHVGIPPCFFDDKIYQLFECTLFESWRKCLNVGASDWQTSLWKNGATTSKFFVQECPRVSVKVPTFFASLCRLFVVFKFDSYSVQWRFLNYLVGLAECITQLKVIIVTLFMTVRGFCVARTFSPHPRIAFHPRYSMNFAPADFFL